MLQENLERSLLHIGVSVKNQPYRNEFADVEEIADR